jgi:two-component system, sensor histidine kinase PdtaS
VARRTAKRPGLGRGPFALTVGDNGLKTRKPEGVGALALLTQQLGGTMSYENLELGCRVTLRMAEPGI